jgi:pimeloyl-ACP methyl ester carboxylesterase
MEQGAKTTSDQGPQRSSVSPPGDPRLVFLHANGFPGGVYRRFIARLSTRVAVEAMPLIEEAGMTPPSRRWPAMVRAVVEYLQAPARSSASVALVGHSMGGYLALMAARQIRARVTGIVLIDAPMVTGWRSAVLSAAQVTGWAHRAGPAPVAARRRFEWDSARAAHEFFATKTFVRRWAPGVLEDFVDHGLRALDDGRVTLTVAREVERDIYAELAHRRALTAFRELREHRVAIGFIAGARSEEMRLAGRQQNRRLFHSHWRELPTGHLVPMERPDECADAVLDLLGIGRPAAGVAPSRP